MLPYLSSILLEIKTFARNQVTSLRPSRTLPLTHQSYPLRSSYILRFIFPGAERERLGRFFRYYLYRSSVHRVYVVRTTVVATRWINLRFFLHWVFPGGKLYLSLGWSNQPRANPPPPQEGLGCGEWLRDNNASIYSVIKFGLSL